MNLPDLRDFAGVAETRGVSLAAELLYRSQPAVSRAIQEREAELGVPLFVREGRRMTPRLLITLWPPPGSAAGRLRCRDRAAGGDA